MTDFWVDVGKGSQERDLVRSHPRCRGEMSSLDLFIVELSQLEESEVVPVTDPLQK